MAADLIIAFVVLLGGASAAEWVRSFCSRRLTTPMPTGRAAAAADTGLQLPQ
jgi:hypothetical protein